MAEFPVCTQCGFTWAEYRARGLVGCPQCYASFGDGLLADLNWMHAPEHPPAAEAPAAFPGRAAAPGREAPADRLARLREELADALRKEQYEEAARLRRQIGESGHGVG